jgi:hypothetical protein
MLSFAFSLPPSCFGEAIAKALQQGGQIGQFRHGQGSKHRTKPSHTSLKRLFNDGAASRSELRDQFPAIVRGGLGFYKTFAFESCH